MAQKLIGNPGQAFSLGGTWGTPSIDNAMSQTTYDLINGTGLILYPGDIVCMDATGTQAVLSTSIGDPRVIGVVGAPTEFSTVSGTWAAGVYTAPTLPVVDSQVGAVVPAAAGNFAPFTDQAVITASLGFTNASATVTYGSASTAHIGRTILTPYNASTNANPQIFTIVAAVANTSYTVNTTFTGTTGSFTCQIVDSYQTFGPGWATPLAGAWTTSTAAVPGTVVPVITQGFGYVNINAVAATVATDAIQVTSGSVVGQRTANGSLTAAQIGQSIATTLQAYAARNAALTNAGISGHDSVLAIIGKF